MPKAKRAPNAKPKPMPKAKRGDNLVEMAFNDFRAIDNDKNGKITLKELNASRQHPGSKDPNGPIFDIKKEFERMDDDKDGAIEIHEVEAFILSQNQVDFELADEGDSDCEMTGWTSIKTPKECEMAQLKLKKTDQLFKNSKFVNASGNGTDLPFGCIWDNVSGGKETHVYINLDGKTISKDKKLRAICKKDKALRMSECKNKPCGELCFQKDFNVSKGWHGVCDGNGVCVSRFSNPCEVHGCDGKKCGDECLRDGDIMGFCDKDLYCDYNRKPCEEANFTNCLGNLDKKLPQGKLSLRDTRFLPEQCRISRSEEKKCLVWLGKNRDFAIESLDPCLQTLNEQKQKTKHLFLHGTPASCKACIASASTRCPYLSKNGFPEFTNCEDRKPARATCGANHQCMSQRCSPYTSGKKCARCQGSGGQDCGTACDDDDKCCSGSCTCGNDGNPGGSGTRCC